MAMPMNFPKGQVGPSTGVVGTNAIVVHPTYTNPIASVPQVNYAHHLVNDDRMSELDGFEAPYTFVSYGPGIPLEGTCKPFGPVPSYGFNSWQAKQSHERSVQEIDQPNMGSLARSTIQVGHADPSQGKVILPEVKEILAEHEAKVVHRIQ
jgi:hypothetical protein